MTLSIPSTRPGYPRGGTPAPATLRSRLQPDLRLFGVSTAVLLLIAALIFYGLDVFNQDALSRTVDAHNVLASRDPPLGAIGLSWPPLPTIARVPFMAILGPLGLAEFAGPITSVLAAAGCVVLMNRILLRFEIAVLPRALWIVLTLANPVGLYHAVNGTAESMFVLCFLWTFLAAIDIEQHPERAVMGMGLATGLALWTRYEAIAILATATAGYLFLRFMNRRRGAWREDRLESLFVTLFLPSAFLLGLWLYFNWQAQGDPLFFYRGPYSINAAPDVARNAPDHPLTYAYRHPVGAITYVVERTLQMSLLFPVVAVTVTLVGLGRRALLGPVLVMLAVSTVLMQAYQTYTGTIAPWLRYWIYPPIFAPLLAGWLIQNPPMAVRTMLRGRAMQVAAIPAVILLGNLVAFQTMGHADVGADEQLFRRELLRDGDTASLRSFYPDRGTLHEIAAQLRDTDGLVVVDVQKAAVLILDMDGSRLAINTDRDFQHFLDRPVGNVDYFLLPDPQAKGVEVKRDAIYARFPTLYDGAPWLKLEREFPGEINWRLYAVIRPPAGDGRSPAR